MPRHARRLSSTGIYHIMLRGINQQQILEDREDNKKFIEILKDCKLISGFKLYAYCLMGNHLHLIIRIEKEPLEQVFKRICGRYAYWYNAKYCRVGHLFQDRFKSEPIEDEKYFLSVFRYIHQNPVKAGLVKKLEEYPYSSYNCYVKSKGDSLVDTDFVLDMMDREQLEVFHSEESEDTYLDIKERPFRLTDEQAKEIIRKVTKCKNASEVQLLEVKKRNSYIRKLRKEGLSIRQISRLTGISKGIIERCSK
ncbi:MAG: transposase [Bacillota bacterium]|nr:transposase [Bacillota bacterium]HHU29921.1 transposase [Bacillota bacterium]